MIQIGVPKLSAIGAEFVYEVDIDAVAGLPDRLWYSVDPPYSDYISGKADAALIGLLIPAMVYKEDLAVKGEVSLKLLHGLGELQAVLCLVIPSLSPITIYADSVSDAVSGPRPAGVATGFSGGIDSFCTLVEYGASEGGPPYKPSVDTLLFNNVGSHASGKDELFRQRYARLAPLAEELRLPFLRVSSNLDDFYNRGLNFQQTHTVRNASVALLLQSRIGYFLYASAYHYRDIFVGPTNSMAHSDPITLPLMSTETLTCMAAGTGYTRVSKTLRVAELPSSYQYLDVCTTDRHPGPHTNCSKCQKCLRTLATLEIAGMLQNYSSVFDLEAYESDKAWFYSEVLFSQDQPLMREIAEFAREREFTFPLKAKARSIAKRVWRSRLGVPS